MNGVIAINKRENMTSFDVVRQIQRKLGVKAGHSGTLDPNATGVLV
ncbi:MAG: tRNA pseudouridine(55) synthase TruB, partial [Erysipelothrix sp.]|nr:tRNA pseudouridine(55) synthase TruB [Erysipelothrix sp.]